MMAFLLSALRAVVEMLGLCLIGQGILFVLAGRGRKTNPIYRLFQLITAAPTGLVARVLPNGVSTGTIARVTFVILLLLWLLLAYLRRFV